MRKLIILIVILLLFLGAYSAAQTYFPQLQQYLSSNETAPIIPQGQVKVMSEESVTVAAVKKVGPSVVTIEEMASPQASSQQLPFDFSPFFPP